MAQAILSHPRRRSGQALSVGVIGLGVGTLAVWGRQGDTYRFYEIHPAAERLAREFFTFLRDSEAHVEIVLGDGRIMLERELADGTGGPRYDVLIIDAFSGDAVPVHLLTLESLELYRRALAPGSVLVLQITNRHVDLERVVRGLADATGLQDSALGPGAARGQWRHHERVDVAGSRGHSRPGRGRRHRSHAGRISPLDGRL